MKQFIALFLTVLLLFSIVSCSDVNPPIPQETEPLTVDSGASSEESETALGEATTTTTETIPVDMTEKKEILHILDAPPAKQFDILEVGGEYSPLGYIDPENHISDVYFYPIERYTDPNSEPRKMVVFLDRIYEVTYYQSEKAALYGSHVDTYLYSESGIRLTVRFDRQTGSIRDLQYSDSRYQDTKNPDDVRIEEECYEKALEFLPSLVDAVGYELTDKTVGPAGGFGGLCTYEFTRFINGVKTSNQVRISVTFYGDVVAYYLNTPEPLDLSKMPTGEALDALSQRVKDRWDAAHTELPYGYEFLSYEIEELEFIRLFDGRYALLYTVKANFREYIYDHDHFNYERAQYLVYLD